MSLVPIVFAGVMQVIEVDEATAHPVAATPPMLTVAPDAKLAPPNVTDVPPDTKPLIGTMDVSVGTR
jgi:hypothetical protein